MPSTCLCVIFNHPYTENIPLLRELYGDRFSEIRFLVPLKRMPDPDVITVYRGSYQHNAYLTDALHAFPRHTDLFFFVHDDVLLAPALNEGNLSEVFGIRGRRDAFMAELQGSPPDLGQWGHWLGPLWRLTNPRNFLSGTGVEGLDTVLRSLPPAPEALRRTRRYGGKSPTTFQVSEETLAADKDLFRFRYFPGCPEAEEQEFKAVLLRNLIKSGGPGLTEISVPYPFIVSGPASDLCIFGADILDDLAHYSGVLAAAGLFVEIAFPTALALAADRIITAPMADLTFDWSTTWLPLEPTLDRMSADPHLVAAHPVKLSQVQDKPAMLDRMREARSWPVGGDASGTEPLPDDFVGEQYLSLHPDVRAAGVDPSLHYASYGKRENRAYRLDPPGLSLDAPSSAASPTPP